MLSFGGHENFTFIEGDVTDYEKINPHLNYFDVVIHLAAIVGYSACRRDEKKAYEINHLATKNIAENLDADKLMLFASTGSNYGEVDGICTEETPTNPLSIYAKSKELGEIEVAKRENFVAYRFATAFGASPRLRLDLLINEFTYLAQTQKYLVIYESHFMRTFIHVRDMANSFLFAIENADKMSGEIYNVGSNSMNYSKKDVCDIISSKTEVYIHHADFDGDADKRNYVVSYDKINALGFDTTTTVEEGVDELLSVLPMVREKNRYRN
jgi:nucleoside-diphosphate-sugar epimerase